ncbi:MAG: imidazole glycerol phosphate synthase subunit HisH [Desulfobacteraceae bacterium]|nr:MAG: imidazole glycerol phosphate synthase subunit HisH [Desulfobacteraceae bacterium]
MIAIIDYKAGNLTSVQRALDSLGRRSVITRVPAEIAEAERIIFPGVGAAGKAMADLKELQLDRVLVDSFSRGKPILGICLGTQIIMEWSEENKTECLGLIRGSVVRFPEELRDVHGDRLKVPHMGWNRVNFKRSHPALQGIDPESEFYFVHSYYPRPADPDQVLGETSHGLSFASVLSNRNLMAVQFHPEKSGRAGLSLLSNFCEWKGGADA